ncbi:MAG: hypothetical protein QHH13_11175 [Melioribacter sp.]|uniref:hypothetical protein n=1 Tax=Rosettibacter primus TaxID=3111523 RepID=UPI00247B5752|nr:hypothetical protein [Melioribacter sp.]
MKLISKIILLLSSGGLIYSLMSFEGRTTSQSLFDFAGPQIFAGHYYPLEYKIIATVCVLLIISVLLFKNKNHN